jgi:hypothetical protein
MGARRGIVPNRRMGNVWKDPQRGETHKVNVGATF